MKITKIAHSCLLIEEANVRILTDPGNFSYTAKELRNIDIILITHEHKDHLDIELLKEILKNNPEAKIITNKSVGKILDKENVRYEALEDNQKKTEKGILIEGVGKTHALIHKNIPLVANVGYFINHKLFFPGDELIYPKKPVEILAAPITVPWASISETLGYVEKIKPKICFPIHESVTNLKHLAYNLPQKILEDQGIKFIALEEGKSFED